MQTNLSDMEVLEKSLQNPKYFEIIVDRYQAAFIRKSLQIVKSSEEAEDVVQETFLKIYKNASSFKKVKGASFKSWAYEILRNTAFNHYKVEKKHLFSLNFVDFSEHDVADSSQTPVEEIESQEQSSYVKYILSLMPKTLSTVLRLHFLEDKSQEEIAKIENISNGAVRVRIHRAKNLFREMHANNNI